MISVLFNFVMIIETKFQTGETMKPLSILLLICSGFIGCGEKVETDDTSTIESEMTISNLDITSEPCDGEEFRESTAHVEICGPNAAETAQRACLRICVFVAVVVRLWLSASRFSLQRVAALKVLALPSPFCLHAALSQ